MKTIDPRDAQGRDGGEDLDTVSLDLTMSTDNFRALERLARSSGASLNQVVAKAFLLYREAAEASRVGKAVGVASTPDVLETEFVGF